MVFPTFIPSAEPIHYHNYILTLDPLRSILVQRSTVFLDMIQNQAEICLDQFTDCLEGLLDGIDLLYGAEVTLTLHNIQPLLKFILHYKVEGMLEGCLGWIKKERLSMANLFTFWTVCEKH